MMTASAAAHVQQNVLLNALPKRTASTLSTLTHVSNAVLARAYVPLTLPRLNNHSVPDRHGKL